MNLLIPREKWVTLQKKCTIKHPCKKMCTINFLKLHRFCSLGDYYRKITMVKYHNFNGGKWIGIVWCNIRDIKLPILTFNGQQFWWICIEVQAMDCNQEIGNNVALFTNKINIKLAYTTMNKWGNRKTHGPYNFFNPCDKRTSIFLWTGETVLLKT